MTPTQIQQWAREAGLQLDVMVERYPVLNAQLQAFAALARADLEAEVESLREQVRKEQMYVQGLAADAARYHGFRKALMEDDDTFIDRAADLIPDEDVPITADMVDAAFDAAIDAAMKKTK